MVDVVSATVSGRLAAALWWCVVRCCHDHSFESLIAAATAPLRIAVPVYYMTLSGPASAFPSFDSATIAAISQALHAALGLPDDYVVDAFVAWPPPNFAGHRRLLASIAADTVVVIGFSLVGPSTGRLPDALALGTFVDDAGVVLAVTNALSRAGLLTSQNSTSGSLSVGLSSGLYSDAKPDGY